MKQKKGVGYAPVEIDVDPGTDMKTPVKPSLETPVKSSLDTSSSKGKKLGIKRVKKKADLNLSKVKLKSIGSPKNFSFLNVSVQKQTLRANNRALAQNLARARQDIRNLRSDVQDVRSKNQELNEELLRLKRLVGLKDDQIQTEVRLRMQEEMQRMGSLLDGLTQSMIQSSTFINDLKDRTLMYSYRRSTDSVRTSSLGNEQTNDVAKSTFTTRSILKDNRQEDSTIRYLSKADEFAAHPGGRIYDKTNSMDMSIIAEQSILADGEDEMFCYQPLDAVDEVTSVVNIQEPSGRSKPVSMLPQRVLKNSKKVSSINSDNEIETTDDNNKAEKNKTKITERTTEATESNVKTVSVKEEPKTKRSIADEVKTQKSDIDEKNESKDRKRKMVEEAMSNNVSETEILGNNEPDNFLDADISAFGFSNLVSASPIQGDKKDDLLKSKVSNTEKAKVKVKSGSFVKPKSVQQIKTLSSKVDKKSTTLKNKSKTEIKHDSHSKKGCRRETFATDNPFVPKTTKVPRSPSELMPETDKKFDDIADPFKPSKTLIRSPVHSNVPSESPEDKVDSLAFLAKIRESSDNKGIEKSPLQEPIYPDEPTTYFDSEMEFTSVIDSAKLIQSFRTEKNSPVLSQRADNCNHGNEKRNSEKANETNEKSKASSDMDVGKDFQDNAAVEVRTKKPGVFTFSVGRKEADGTRKPIQEPARSKARSKKKRLVTPEKDEHRTGNDRDMFNFGDRTPTVPLEKLAKTKNVFDMSMNDTVVPSYDEFKKKKDFKVPEPKPDEHIYYLPLKGSPDEKPTKPSRSKSRSRSKSKKCDDDDDEDWVPDQKSYPRSKSRGGDSVKDESSVRRGRSRSRRRVAEVEVDIDDKETVSEEKQSAWSKPQGQVEKSEPAKRHGRSRSRRRIADDEIDGTDDVRGSKYHSKEGTNILDTENEIQSVGEEKITSRASRGRSRSRAMLHIESVNESSPSLHKTKPTGLNDAGEKPITVRRSVRSKSQVRKIIVDDSDDESSCVNTNDELRPRSRSISRQKTFNVNEDENKRENDTRKPVDDEHVKEKIEEGCSEKISKDVKNSESVTIVPDSGSDDNVEDKLTEPEDSWKSIRKRRASTKSKPIVESDSTDNDDNMSKKANIHKRTTKSSRYVKHEFIQKESMDNDAKESEKSNNESGKCEDNEVEQGIVNSGFINSKRRGKSSRSHAGLEDDIHDGNESVSKVIDSINTPAQQIRKTIVDSDFESPKTKPKTGKKSSKSTKKSVRKKKKLDDEPHSEKEEETETEEKPSTLEMLKRRLTMIGANKHALEDTTNNESYTRKRSQADIVPLDQMDDEGTPDSKRTRRNKNPVSYKPKPLNSKLRQGDPMFVDVSITKVKAEQARLDLVRKMCVKVPKVSKEDKENIVQS